MRLSQNGMERVDDVPQTTPVAAVPGAAHTAVAAAALAAAPRMNRVSDAAVVAAAISVIPPREPTL